MTAAVLVLNAGSSSIKAAVYRADATSEAAWQAEIDGIGRGSFYRSSTRASATAVPESVGDSHQQLTEWLLEQLSLEAPALTILAAGHRVVHGGSAFSEPVVITDDVLAQLQKLVQLAPSHQPHNLAGIAAVADIWPVIPQVACFDTAFHRSQPTLAQQYALPYWLTEDGVVRYGFHGLSYQYIASVLPSHIPPAQADGRVIVAHLGHGASLCALRKRRSMATSMGFTALDGLVMGKRCGDLDPGVVLHLMRDRGMKLEEADHLLSHESGLLGVSGISDDMRDLLGSDDPRAQRAVDLFVYRAVALIGSLVAQVGGLDALVFTGGMGEHSPIIRARISESLQWLGAVLDHDANAAGAVRIDGPASQFDIRVIPTNEQKVIADSTIQAAL